MVIKNFDYDFNYSVDVNLSDLFKIQNLKPNISNEHWLESLLDFILLIKKYTSTKVFVLLNVHLYFTKEEIDLFYKEILYNRIPLLVLESISPTTSLLILAFFSPGIPLTLFFILLTVDSKILPSFKV